MDLWSYEFAQIALIHCLLRLMQNTVKERIWSQVFPTQTPPQSPNLGIYSPSPFLWVGV